MQAAKVGKRLTKTYQTNHLHDTAKNIGVRLELINKVGELKLNSIPFVCASRLDNTIVIYQDYVDFSPRLTSLESALLKLASDMQIVTEIGFVHGDLNRRNVRTTSEGFKILDFEPCLHQWTKGKVKTMVTLPYLANQDRLLNQITSLTDKLGFFYLAARCAGNFGPRDVVELTKTRNHSLYLGFNENELPGKSYEQLALIAIQPNTSMRPYDRGVASGAWPREVATEKVDSFLL